MVTYDELISAVIHEMASRIGTESAVARAQQVSGLKISDDGTVTGGGSKSALLETVKKFQEFVGVMAVIIARGSIAKLVKDESIDIPDELK